MVKIYKSSSCGGSVVASGTATAAGTFSIMSSVTMNTSTTFTATATDAAGNVSACSLAMTYVENQIPPSAPSGLASSPPSPAASTNPSITGNAQANSTVFLYTNPTCSSAVAGTATATGGVFSIPVTVPSGSTTTFYATATDAENNTSTCSTSFVTYIQDSVPPAVPSNLASVPASPSNSSTPMITGNAEAGSTVKLYTVAGCTGTVAQSGLANAGGMFSLTVTVALNVTTTFYATATDAAGNASGCTTTGLAYKEDSTPPAAPSALTTTPPSPANNGNPTILGGTEASALVKAYTDSSCTTLAASATAATDGTFSIPVTVSAGTTTTFYLVATDAAGNSSTCNAAGTSISYFYDNSAVQTPVLTSTTPT